MIRALLFRKGIYPASLLFSLLLFSSTQIFGQNVGDYRSFGDGNWTARATWQIWSAGMWATPSAVQGYPGQFNTSANVTILNGNTVTFNSGIGPTIASLQLGSTSDASSGTLIFNNNRLLTVAGVVTVGNALSNSSGALTMINGGTFSVNSIVVSNATGSSFTPGAGAGVDTVQFNATNTLPAAPFTSFNNIAFSGGTITDTAGFSATGSVIINTTATFVAGTFTYNVGGSWVNNGGTFTANGSTIDFNSVAGNQAINGTATSQTFNNIIVDKTGFTLNAAATLTSLTVGGTLTVLNGTFNMQNTGSNVFAGLVTVNTGATWNNTGNAAIDIQNGITCHGIFTSGTALYTFDTRNQSLRGVLSIKNVSVALGFTVTNIDTLTVGTSLGGTGTLTQGANALLNLGGLFGISTLQTSNSGNTVNYSGASQTILPQNYYNLILSGSGTDIMQTGTNAIAGNFTLSGGVKTTTGDNLTVGGNLSVGDGTTLTVGVFDFAVTGSTTIGTSTSGKFVISAPSNINTFTGLIRTNAGGSWNNSGDANVTVQGGITNTGTFTSGSGIYTFNTRNQDLFGTLAITNVTVTGVILNNNNTLTVANALIGTGGTLFQMLHSTLNLASSPTIDALQAAADTNTVNYIGGAQTVYSTNYFNLGLAGTGAKTLQIGTTSIGGDLIFSGTANATAVAGLTISGNLTIGAGTTFRGATFTHSIGGNFTNNGTFTRNTSTMAFNGVAAQTIGGSTATIFTNLTINNPNGVTLNDGVNLVSKTVFTLLTLSSGYLTTDTNNLIILNTNATTSVANADGTGVPQHNSPYINGPISKVGKVAFIFPVGVLGTGCVPIGISGSSTSQTFRAQYNRSSASSLGSIPPPGNLYNVSLCDYWNLNRTTATSTAVDVTAYWNENSPCNGETPGHYVTDLNTICVAHFNSTSMSWDNSSPPAPSATSVFLGTEIAGGITWRTVNTFSPFALGNSSAAKDNPLAIKLDYFTAVKASGYNILSWQAECTSSSNAFEAQRSNDGVSFTSIDTVRINNAADCSQPSSYNDYTSSGNNVYYRVKMTDASGVVSYSDIVLLSTAINAIDFIGIAPNPVRNDATIKISSSRNDKVEIVLLSLDGKELQRSTIQVQAGANTVNLHAANLAKGVYIVRGIFSGGQTHTIKFIKE